MVRRKSDPVSTRTNRAPAVTPGEREHQLVSLAFDLAEKQMREGTASSQVITQFLKLGSTRESLEQEKIRNENALLATKKEIMESQKAIEAVYEKALNAMRAYSGQSPVSQDSDNEDFDGSDVF